MRRRAGRSSVVDRCRRYANVRQPNGAPATPAVPAKGPDNKLTIPNTKKEVTAKYFDGTDPEWAEGKNPRQLLAEFLGTFYLCFPGIAAILATATGVEPGAALVAIALAHGLGLSLAVNNFGGISGAHVNPAVTAGFLVTGRIAPPMAIAYVVAQLLKNGQAALISQRAQGFCCFVPTHCILFLVLQHMSQVWYSGVVARLPQAVG